MVTDIHIGENPDPGRKDLVARRWDRSNWHGPWS